MLRILAIPAALAAGEACGFAAGAFGPMWPLAALAALLAALFGHGLSLRFWRHAATFLLGAALALHASGARRAALDEACRPGRPFERTFVVEAVEERGGRPSWTSFFSSFDGVDVKVVLPLGRGVAPPEVGEVWRCAGWLERRDAGDYRRRRLWVKGSGTFARRDAAAGRSRARAFLSSARHSLSRRLGIGLDGNGRRAQADLNRALLLGERFRMANKDRVAFASAGTIHVFAISGLHVMIVARVLLALLVIARVPYRFAGLALVPALWLYVGVVGAPPSAVRAASMATLYHLAPLAWRRPDALASWAATFVLFHVAAPECLVRAGSLLSFVVMLGILLFVRWAEDFGSRALEAFGTPVAAWVAGAPIAAHFFGRVAPAGLFANFLLVPAASASVAAGVLGILASFASETLAAHFNFAAAMLTGAMAWLSRAVAGMAFASFDTFRWNAWDCAAWYAVAALSLWLVRSVAMRRRASL